MTRRRHFYFLTFFTLLFLTTLACQANSVTPETAVGIDQDAIVRDVVATLQAQMPTPAAADAQISGNTAVDPDTLNFDLQNQLVAVYEKVNPAVVHIFVFNTFDDQEFPLGTGSGFVYDENGYIITNNHVVTDGDTFEVIFADGFRSRAEVVGTDVDSDLAVIKVEKLSPAAQPIPLGDTNQVHVGQFVIAIGNPFGEAGSMSIGIVSGLERTLDSQRTVEGGGHYSLPQVIQTDAAINPGNSGGPLLNLQGEVIGVNSAIRTDTGTNSGVGFSIPVNAVRRIVPSLIANGAYVYPYLGIRMQSLDIDTAEELNIPYTSGAYILAISQDAPAANAGLIASGVNNFGALPGGDLIIAINGTEITSSDDLISYLVFETEAGQTVDLTIVRDGKEMTVPLTLGERP
ncbi:MAG: trypsin-like peptidase domain-containing protein [Chloroflexi bacterium]|nr:trypsin-like peptidase domain-containing protein [Chloroflexota bacterium]MBK6713400.1 trypsin-like peptidase domain-containing protein [Chloroflexota bacterium]MBK7177021.1 trypsin-like peptidase domain-containing protein [Chloroflexota bacterium]MBK8932923.1 trypsin-like peptidase domain-containing protein [Chloroflexota bacterium]MBP6802966.1 trypsin-like peptidase domain-containing protein [Chloroflexota bacterium]